MRCSTPCFSRCLPHARGGVSRTKKQVKGAVKSSPRPWGCFCYGLNDSKVFRVFPTPVGVFHITERISRLYLTSSPRPWGCFFTNTGPTRHSCVFPTPVGVFPKEVSRKEKALGLPHARGGVSEMVALRSLSDLVFPTPVGVFLPVYNEEVLPGGLPHARGGVSP